MPDAEVGSPAVTDLRGYAAQAITARLDKMLSHLDGVRASEDTEPVHQMRVWSRRSRAALEVFRCCFPGKAYTELEREIKSVTDSLGEARDLDVMIETLKVRSQALPLNQRAGLDSFIDRLAQRRERTQKPVEKALKRLEENNLAARFEEICGVKRSAAEAPAKPNGEAVDGQS